MKKGGNKLNLPKDEDQDSFRQDDEEEEEKKELSNSGNKV